MQYSQEHLKTMVYAKFGGQTECIMGNWKIENRNTLHNRSGVLKMAAIVYEREICFTGPVPDRCSPLQISVLIIHYCLNHF